MPSVFSVCPPGGQKWRFSVKKKVKKKLKILIFKIFQKLKKIKTKWGIFSFFEKKFFYKYFRPLEVPKKNQK